MCAAAAGKRGRRGAGPAAGGPDESGGAAGRSGARADGREERGRIGWEGETLASVSVA